MKPIKVIMSAFGSYADKVSLDFKKVQHGLFLISGDTGSGKTTIFDAIVYALYDRTSGGKRDGNMMRSQYASEDVETYVEYTFSYKDSIYTIRRNPEYTRVGKRKYADGTLRFVKETAKVELFLPNGSVFQGKKRETDQEIANIIGVDAEQFTQICMIAQGDFLKLLHAESKERRQIFSRIFQTRPYYQIQEELKKKSTQCYIQLEDTLKDIKRETERAEYDKNSEEADAWTDIINRSIPTMNDTMEVLQRIIDNGREREHFLKEQVQTQEKRLDNLTGQIKEAEAINQVFALYEREKEKEAVIQAGKEQYSSLKEQILKVQKAERVEVAAQKFMETKQSLEEVKNRLIVLEGRLNSSDITLQSLKEEERIKEEHVKRREPLLVKELVSLEEGMGQYEQLEKLEKDGKEFKKQFEEGTADLHLLTKEIERLENAQYEIKERFLEIEDSPRAVEQLTVELERITERIARLDGLFSEIQRMQKRRNIAEALANTAERDTNNYRKSVVVYEERYQAFLNAQAGILAYALESGEPCPVCGSCHHPNVKQLAEEAPTQEEVEQAKYQRNKAEQERDESNGLFQEAMGELHLQEGEVKKEYKILYAVEYENVEEAVALQKTEQARKESRDNQKNIESKRNRAIRELEELKKLKEKQEEIVQKKIEVEKKVVRQREVVTKSQIAYKEQEAQWKVKRERLSFPSREQAKEKLQSVREEIEAGRKALIQLRENTQKEARLQEQLKGEKNSVLQHKKEVVSAYDQADCMYQNELLEQGFTEDEFREKKILISQLPDMLMKAGVYEQERQENLTILKSLQGQIADRKKVDILYLKEASEDVRMKLLTVKEQHMQQYGKNEKNTEVKTKLTQYYDKQKAVREEYELIGNLSKTANGNLSGSVKLDFETYIQRQYFKQIIKAANKRLCQMNQEEFLLQCREVRDLKTQGQAGLDLDVYHMVSDTVRDVRTLSGGESFMAALSMALGLADIITNTAGAIHLDTMFVDEGFGSLDDNAREMAIKVLCDLAGGNGLVGIISHVNELKEQIDCKLFIKKTEKGSSMSWSFE